MTRLVVPWLPRLTVRVEGLNERAMLPFPELVPAMVTPTLPLEAACVLSPAYCATMVWTPTAVKLTVAKAAVPFDVSVAVCGVHPVVPYAVPQPSIESVTVPVGTVAPVLDATATVIVSLAPEAGVVVAAETVVVVPMRVEVFAGHTPARAERFTEPRPVTRS